MAWYDRAEQERRDEERRQYHGDVTYDVWCSGGNPDRIDYDRVEDCRYAGETAEQCAASHMGRIRAQEQARRDEEAAFEEAQQAAAEEYYAMMAQEAEAEAMHSPEAISP